MSEQPEVILAIWEWSRHNWKSLREIAGSGEEVGEALRELVMASTPEAAQRWYWRLENHAVVQGSLYETALHVVPVVLAALAGKPSRPARMMLMELLFQIVAGVPSGREAELGNIGLGDACRTAAREGIWLIYREMLASRPTEALAENARYVLDRIELDRDRFDSIVGAWLETAATDP